MNLKTKAFGLLAGTALSLSLISGVVAEPTSATLAENPSGVCTAAITELGANFGTYTWNGTSYVAATNSGTAAFNMMVSQTIGPSEVCDISVAGTNLASANGSIPVSAIAVAHGTASQTLSGTSTRLMAGVTGAQKADLTLANPGTSAPDGTYTGTITFTAAKGS